MASVTLVPTQEQIDDLRNRFNEKYQAAQNDDLFHPADLSRIRDNDDWVRRFLEHTDLNIDESFQLMWEACEWRKQMDVNGINETNVKMDYLIEGSFFSHGRDKDGCSLFIFKSKKHIKNSKNMDELKRCVIYWFERLERQDKGKSLSLFFDMADTGLSNMDMEFTKYLIGLFKQYYPNFLNYILIFEMPWVLNAAFKIIKSWLPPKAVEKIKFVNKKNLDQFVTPDQALTCWGGNDDYNFSFVPENVAPESGDAGNNRKVHFADGSSMADSPTKRSEQDPNASLSIYPPEVIPFKKEGSELQGSFVITNKSSKTVVYKVKTTSPEKFRVRPSSGLLKENDEVNINVTLQPGFHLGGLVKDKFLVMSMTADTTDLSGQDINDLWKNSTGKPVEQYRLRCGEIASIISRNGSILNTNTPETQSNNQFNQVFHTLQKINESQLQLHKSIRRTQLLQMCTIVLITIVAVLGYYVLKDELKQNISDKYCYRSQ